MNTVYFYGSFPGKKSSFGGGGEIGNLRTVQMLRQFGYKVRIVKKYRCGGESTPFLIRLLTYPVRAALSLAQFACLLIVGNRKAMIHISGFYGNVVYAEYLFVLLSKLLGYKVLYEMRGGGAEQFYTNGNSFYRHCFRFIVRKSSIIFSQGIENEKFLRTITNTPIFYYPNYLKTDFLPNSVPVKPDSPLHIIYLGRLSPEKNIQLIVDATAILQKHLQVDLTIVGQGEKRYVDSICELMHKRLSINSFTIINGSPHDEVGQFLADKHFIIFPSKLEREGQSNTITEAMGFGIVPISSPQGFSRTLIGNSNLIVEDLSAESYANKLLEIVQSGQYELLSKQMHERVVTNYSEDVIKPKVKEQYDRLFNW